MEGLQFYTLNPAMNPQLKHQFIGNWFVNVLTHPIFDDTLLTCIIIIFSMSNGVMEQKKVNSKNT